MKKFVSFALALIMLLSVCAFAMAEGADTKGTGVELTVYTNSGSSGRADWLRERAAQDGFKLTIVEEGAGAVQQRLINEGAATPCDVVFGLNAIIWNDLISRDIIAKIDPPSWASEVSEGLNDPNGYYYAIVKQAILLAYDTNQVAPEDAPKDWPDLWENEKFWTKYESQIKLTGGTTRNVLAGILTRYIDPNGELGISDEGWAAIEAFFAHGTPVEDGVDLYAQIVNAREAAKDIRNRLMLLDAEIVCPGCGKTIKGVTEFCANCGTKLPEPNMDMNASYDLPTRKAVVNEQAAGTCSNCGAPLKPGAAFCTNCGTPVK